MKGFYNVTETIYNALNEDVFCNTVIYGNTDEIDLKKQTIYPLANFVVTNVSHEDKTLVFSFELTCADIVDQSIENEVNGLLSNNNEQDVLNTQLAVVTRLIERLKRGDLHTDLYQLRGNPSSIPFTARFHNLLAGYTCTFDVEIFNDMGIC